MKQIESYRNSLCNIEHYEECIAYILLMLNSFYSKEERASLGYCKLITDLSILDLTLEVRIDEIKKHIDQLEILAYEEMQLVNSISELSDYEDIKPVQDAIIDNVRNQTKLIEYIEYYL